MSLYDCYLCAYTARSFGGLGKHIGKMHRGDRIPAGGGGLSDAEVVVAAAVERS